MSAPRASLVPTAERVLVLLSALALCACARTSEREGSASRTAHVPDATPGLPSTPNSTEVSARDSVLKLLDDYGRSFGEDRASVISRLGTPHHVATRVALDGTRMALGGADSTIVLRYLYASFELSLPKADYPETLWTIRVWGRLPGLPPMISFGSTTRSDVTTMLGPPDYSDMIADSTVLSYGSPKAATDLINLYMVRDTLRVLEWAYRVG
jgi:hypothetical protein